MTRSWLAPALGALLLACTSSSPKGGGPDASTVALTGAPSVVRQLASFSVLANHLGGGELLARRDGGFGLVSGAPHFTTSSLSAMKVTLPAKSDAALRIEDTARHGFTLDLAAEDVVAVAGQPHEGALVFAGAQPDVDLVQIVEPDRVEEIRLLRSPTAKPEARWHVQKGTGVAALRVRDGIVEAIDVEGRIRLRTEPAFAVDSRGTRRAVTLTLEGESLVARFDAHDLVYPVALDPTWVSGLSALPTTTYRDVPWFVLSDGRVAAFANNSIAAAVMDPVTEKWTQVGTSSAAKQYGVATMLGTNKILLSGGEGRSTAELWTAATGPVATGSLSVVRSDAGWVHLDRGLASEKVVVYGGSTGWGAPGSAYSTTEQYSVATGTWSLRATSMPASRLSHTATYLGDGTVLVAGGRTGGGWDPTALLHDLAADSYSALPNLPVNKANHLALALASGNAFLIGGTNAAYSQTNTTILYNRATKTFTAGPPMKYSREGAALLPYGTKKWLVLGGNGKLVGSTFAETYLSTSEIYDEDTNTWTDGPSMLNGRSRFGAVWLADGRIVVGGGAMASGVTADKVEFLVPDKKTCTSGSECASGICSEGYCCNRACTGQCEACDVGGREGVCITISGEAPHGTKPSCGTYVQCGPGGACATACASDAACAATTAYCTSGNVCAPKKTNGAGCTFGNECTSGNCVDGVCCNTTCIGQCYACAETGSVGTCTAVDGAPRGTRSACTAPYACAAGSCASGCTKDAECASTSYCETSSNTCKPKLAAGTACTANTNCTTGFCVDGYCCNSGCTGTCQACNVPTKFGTCSNVPVGGAPSTGKSCSPFATCNGAGACATTCATDAQCAGAAYCLGSACVTRKANGLACGSNLECTSGFCAAGVCCNSACSGECEACGTGTCTPKAATVLCGLSGCVGNYLVPKGKCNGTTNACDPQPATACSGALKCANATTCLTTCTTDADCVSGVCSGGACVVSFDAGSADTSVPDTFVPDTFVPDTFVADTSVADTFVADTTVPDTFVPDTAVADTWTIAETPAPKLADKPEIVPEFKRCSRGSECPSGFCVEGVCCDSACGDRCHSCALLSNPGKCTLEPIGVDLKSECGPALACLGTCGDKGECVGSGTGTMCARNRCTGPSTGAGPAYCGGPGAKCPTDDAFPFNCEPYICEPAFGACRTVCVTSNDCAQGFTCDTATKSCLPIPPPPEVDDSGCAVSAPGVSRAGLGGLVALLGLGLFARRRVSTRR